MGSWPQLRLDVERAGEEPPERHQPLFHENAELRLAAGMDRSLEEGLADNHER